MSGDEIIVFAARPTFGKTAIAASFAEQMHQFGPGVIIAKKAQSAFQIPVKGMPKRGRTLL